MERKGGKEERKGKLNDKSDGVNSHSVNISIKVQAFKAGGRRGKCSLKCSGPAVGEAHADWPLPCIDVRWGRCSGKFGG